MLARKVLVSAIVSAVVALALAVGMSPAVSFAAYDLKAGLTDLAAQSKSKQCLKSASSAKRAVYVIANEAGSKYSYNKNGLLVKITYPSTSTADRLTYAYDKKMRLSKFKSTPKSPYVRKSSGTFSYDKKGRLKKLVSNGSHGSNTYALSFKYDKEGNPKTTTSNFNGYGPTTTYNSFDKKGRLVKTRSASSGSVTRYAYDSKGNLVKAGAQAWKNKYENGLLVQRGETTYKYKRIYVPKKYVTQVKRQQWALINQEANFVFPPYF